MVYARDILQQVRSRPRPNHSQWPQPALRPYSQGGLPFSTEMRFLMEYPASSASTVYDLPYATRVSRSRMQNGSGFSVVHGGECAELTASGLSCTGFACLFAQTRSDRSFSHEFTDVDVKRHFIAKSIRGSRTSRSMRCRFP